MQVEAEQDMIDGDQGEGAEAPVNQRVRETGDGPLANDFSLAQDFPEKVPDAGR